MNNNVMFLLGHMSMLRKWCEKYGPALKTQSGMMALKIFKYVIAAKYKILHA